MHRTQARILRTVLVILMIFLSLGILLQYGTRRYLIEEKFSQLEYNGKVLANLASAYYSEGAMTNMQFLINMDLAAQFSGCDVLLCDQAGKVILCSDSPTGCYHQQYYLSKDYLHRIVENEGDRDTCILINLYEENRQVYAFPLLMS